MKKSIIGGLSLLIIYSLSSSFSLFSLEKNPYSKMTGLSTFYSGTRSSAMGKSGIALMDSVNYNCSSPASYAGLDYTIISYTYAPQITYLKENSSSTFLDYSDNFPGAELALGMEKYGTVAVGYMVDNVLDYEIVFTDDNGYKTKRFGSGGIYRAKFLYAYSFFQKMLNIGASINAVYGKTKTGNFILKRPEDKYYMEPSWYQKNKYSALACQLGLSLNIKKASIAASSTIPIKKGDIEYEHQFIQYYYAGQDSSVQFFEGKLDSQFLPLSANIGLAYGFSDNFNVAADIRFKRWETNKRSNEYIGGAGLEYIFAYKNSKQYVINIPVRAGYYFHDLGFNKKVYENVATFGFSIPTPRNYGFLNFSIESGIRSSEQFDISETFSRLNIEFVHKSRWGRLRRSSPNAAGVGIINSDKDYEQ